MSLQVWLPLTRDLRQQGLANVTVTNNGATFNSAGKLGGCYAPNGLILTNLGDLKVYPMTIAFWCKTTNTGTPIWEQIVLIDNTSNSQIHGIYVADASRLKYEYNPSVNASNVNPKEWHHYTFIINNGDSKVYVDGVLRSSSSETVTADVIGRLRIGTTSTIQLNDVRIYDHCLSQIEVKELAKGLVLHYPLNRSGFGQENLATCHTIQWDISSSTSNYNYVWANSGTLEPNTTYTFSAEVEVSDNIDKCTIFNYISGDYTGTRFDSFPADGKRHSWTFTTSSTAIGLIIYAGVAGATAGHTATYKNIKIEKGSIETPYVPRTGEELYTTLGLNGTTEYDCSGYCNNGSKITDTITYTSDTAKYAVSTHFNGTYDGILIENLQLSDIINSAVTYAFWIKPENESGARSVYFGSYSGNSWSIEKTAGNVLRLYWNGSPDETCSGATITDGVWQHVCITKSGTSDVKVYINGVQKWTSTATHSNLSFPTTYRIGRDVRSNDGTPYKGLMSDFRIYATALSADDVKSLYQNCATIDSDGTIRGQIRS